MDTSFRPIPSTALSPFPTKSPSVPTHQLRTTPLAYHTWVSRTQKRSEVHSRLVRSRGERIQLKIKRWEGGRSSEVRDFLVRRRWGGCGRKGKGRGGDGVWGRGFGYQIGFYFLSFLMMAKIGGDKRLVCYPRSHVLRCY